MSKTVAQPRLIIVGDSNEKAHGQPLKFSPSVALTFGTLSVGDYSLKGFEDKIVVERKRLLDLLNCLGGDRERFIKCLEKMRHYERKWIVCQFEQAELTLSNTYTGMNPNAVYQSVASIEAVYGIPFRFFPSGAEAAKWIESVFTHYLLWKRKGCKK